MLLGHSFNLACTNRLSTQEFTVRVCLSDTEGIPATPNIANLSGVRLCSQSGLTCLVTHGG
jgi:hypothetical protein